MKGRGKWNDDRMVWDMWIQGQGDMGLHNTLREPHHRKYYQRLVWTLFGPCMGLSWTSLALALPMRIACLPTQPHRRPCTRLPSCSPPCLTHPASSPSHSPLHQLHTHLTLAFALILPMLQACPHPLTHDDDTPSRALPSSNDNNMAMPPLSLSFILTMQQCQQ